MYAQREIAFNQDNKEMKTNIFFSIFILRCITIKQKEFTISVICGAVVNAILNYICISRLKVLGACIATVAAEFTVICVQLYFIKEAFNIVKILKISLKYLICVICMFMITLFIGNVFNSKILSICMQVIIGAIIYFGMLYITKDIIIKELEKIFLRGSNKYGKNK